MQYQLHTNDFLSNDNALLSQIGQIVAPERDLLARFFLALDRDIRNRGYELSVYSDFEAFKTVTSGFGKALFPAFDPAHNDLEADQAFWMAIRRLGGDQELVAIQGGKLQLLHERTLGDYIATGRFFYADPLASMESGERFLLTGNADAFASGVRDRVAYSGGTTIDPRWRGRTNLAKLLPLLSHALGYARWYSDWVFSLIDEGIHSSVVAKHYAHTSDNDGFEWVRPSMPSRRKWWIVAKPSDMVLYQVEEYLEMPSAERLRVEAPNTAA